ncbi:MULTISPECIES: phage tail protein [Dickeya]|uniref:Microcystin dependent protein n=1 Tax=Dickeya aquatica TaxID=1401087 RepID=A0A375AFI5_9GAMM|nr:MULTISPECIES: tail fiber protein [Dickeya]SLM64747.1 Microcystin dependent protein [Dickeya aquatica]
MKRVQRLFVKSVLAGALGFAMLPTSVMACAAEPYVGSVCYMVTSYCPDGYLRANGQLVPINQYQALYALVGYTWGGSQAQGTFGLPDLRSRVVAGTGQGPGLSNVALGQTYGAENVALTANNVAPHIHPATLSPNSSLTGTASVAIPVVTGAATTNVPGNTVSLAGTSPSFDLSPIGGTDSPAKIYSNAATNATLKPFGVPFSLGTLSGVTINANTGGTPFSVRNPSVGLTACIAVQGIFPMNPN